MNKVTFNRSVGMNVKAMHTAISNPKQNINHKICIMDSHTINKH